MRNFILFVTLILVTCITAQDTRQKDPNVELPEFVITGIEKVTLPVLPKPKAEIVTLISEDFIRPSYSPEELNISTLSDPEKKEVNILQKENGFYGNVNAGLGVYTLPVGQVSLGTPFQNGLIKGDLLVKNIRNYVDNADYSTFGAKVFTSIFSDNNSDFLPGSNFKLGANYNYLNYKFYGSMTPDHNRSLHFSNIYFGYSNFPTENFKLDFKIDERIFFVKDLNLMENNFNVDGFIQTGFKEFLIGGNLTYGNYYTKADLAGSAKYNFINVHPYAEFNLSDHFTVRGGIVYAHLGSSNLFSPTAAMSLLFSDKVSFFAELNPDAIVLDPRSLAEKNRFYAISTITPVMQKEKFNLKGAIKYEYETYFEIDAGMQYVDYDKYFYFSDTSGSGYFTLDNVNGKKLSGFVNFLFHTGPNGVFYGGVILENLKAGNGNFIPYSPSLKLNATYGYAFSNGLYVEPKLDFYSHSYNDIENSQRISEFVDASVKFEYKLSGNFNIFSIVSNILNHKNYFWQGYREKKLDLLFGINYKW